MIGIEEKKGVQKDVTIDREENLRDIDSIGLDAEHKISSSRL